MVNLENPTMEQLKEHIAKILPDFTIDEDGEGQIIINTGLWRDQYDNLYESPVYE
jgi:hypothetical protein